MNENSMKKRKDWIKNAAIVFLVVLLILTFFSNTIMNYSLPQVATDYVTNGTITTKIRGTGMVESVDPYSVILGDENSPATARKISKLMVQVGDSVEKGDVLLLLDEKTNTALDELEQAVDAAQDKVDAAQEAYDMQLLADGVNENVIAQANGSFDAAAYSNQIVAAQNAVDAQQQVVDDLQKTIDAFNLQLGITGNNDSNVVLAEKVLNEIKTEYETAQLNLPTLLTAYENAQKKLDEAIAAGKTEEEQKPLIEKRDAAKKSYDETKKIVDKGPSNIAEGELALENAKRAQQNALGNLNQQLVNYQLQHRDQTVILEQHQATLQELQTNKNLILALKSAKSALQDAKSDLKEAKAKLAEAEDTSLEASVVADVAGTISSIAFKSGETVSTGETLMVIQPAGQGYTINIPVTTEQAKRVTIGDTAELVNNWWYSEVNAVLKSIRPDTSDPANKKLLVFSLEGDVTEGQNLTLAIGDRSSNYELIVPNSAIREDNNGKFVLKIETKSSPLGNRYRATRVDVEVLAEDDTRSAIKGALYNWDYVITTSTQPIEAGQLIRLSEN